MIRSMLKYKWMCIAVLCCAIFAACEPASDTPTAQTPITFNNGPARAQQVPASDANARIWAYYTTSTTPATTYDVYGSITGNTTASQTPSTPTGEGEKAKLEIGSTTDDNGNFNGTFTVNGNTKYWDKGTYKFYSIYSEDFKTSTDATFTDNELSFTYSIANQNELRLATATVEATKTHDKAVPFQFNHLLSRIKFRGSSSVDGMPIKMTKFIVTATKTAEYAIATNVTCTTAIETTQLPYADGVKTVEIADGSKLKYTELPYAATLADGKELKKIEGTKETDEDYAWLVFPTTADKISIIVEYVDNQGIITQKTATLPSTTTLEMGKSYIFQFSIQPSGPIVFANEVIINDWNTEIDAGDIEF